MASVKNPKRSVTTTSSNDLARIETRTTKALGSLDASGIIIEKVTGMVVAAAAFYVLEEAKKSLSATTARIGKLAIENAIRTGKVPEGTYTEGESVIGTVRGGKYAQSRLDRTTGAVVFSVSSDYALFAAFEDARTDDGSKYRRHDSATVAIGHCDALTRAREKAEVETEAALTAKMEAAKNTADKQNPNTAKVGAKA
jgi:hypothetical protein